MATITGLTAERMLGIEAESVVDGEVRGDGHLWLIKHDGSEIDAGPVLGPPGPAGPSGPAAISAIPGEVRMWSGTNLPAIGTYGRWVWANGAVYVVSEHPIAAGHIASGWRTFAGASDPGVANFRVPDLRGLVPSGMDQMPGDGSRANRMTRSVAITIAARTGEETHVLTVPEMPAHTHLAGSGLASYATYGSTQDSAGVDGGRDKHVGPATSVASSSTGGNGAHENVQPTVFVPYIVYLDG